MIAHSYQTYMIVKRGLLGTSQKEVPYCSYEKFYEGKTVNYIKAPHFPLLT